MGKGAIKKQATIEACFIHSEINRTVLPTYVGSTRFAQSVFA